MTSIDEAAAHLIERLNAPLGALSVSIYYGSDTPVIRVSAQPRFRHLVASVPKEVDGYSIELWSAPQIHLN